MRHRSVRVKFGVEICHTSPHKLCIYCCFIFRQSGLQVAAAVRNSVVKGVKLSVSMQ